jgi:hypothetical protein
MATSRKRTVNPFVGRWRIEEMELWDRDYIDLDGPGYLNFDDENTGEISFGAILGWLDCRLDASSSEPRVEFSWEGKSENDPICGRGWAWIQNGELHGRLFMHMGDDSSFVARKRKGAI